MKDEKDKGNMKTLLIFVLASAVSTFDVFMGYTTGLPEYIGNILGGFIIFYIIVNIIEKFVPKKKNEEHNE